jgi:hypothetical protein
VSPPDAGTCLQNHEKEMIFLYKSLYKCCCVTQIKPTKMYIP